MIAGHKKQNTTSSIKLSEKTLDVECYDMNEDYKQWDSQY